MHSENKSLQQSLKQETAQHRELKESSSRLTENIKVLETVKANALVQQNVVKQAQQDTGYLTERLRVEKLKTKELEVLHFSALF